jgi:hypothetical protein
MTHPNDPDLTFTVDVHHSDTKGETYSIHNVYYKNVDVTKFTIEYAAHLFEQWENELNDNL